jgi:hypothetical protein
MGSLLNEIQYCLPLGIFLWLIIIFVTRSHLYGEIKCFETKIMCLISVKL